MYVCVCVRAGVAKLLLEYGANINTHSNEFKESALTLACYKGHLDMVKFLLSAGTVCLRHTVYYIVRGDGDWLLRLG